MRYQQVHSGVYKSDMKKLMGSLLVLASLGNSSAFASVRFSVGGVKGTIQTSGFNLDSAEAYLQCRLSDGSGIIDNRPTKELVTTLTALSAPIGGNPRYQIEVQGGAVKASALLSKLRSCAYHLKLFGTEQDQERHGDIVLAGSTMSMSGAELSALLDNLDLSKEISGQLSPLQVEIHTSTQNIDKAKN
jgi:hypothetical protein